MNHYDMGIVGCWYWGNYGSLLNGYATHKILKSFGLSALNIITPHNGFENHAKKFFEVAYTKDEISELLPFERIPEFNQMCDMFLTGSDQIWHYEKGDPKFANYFRLDFAEDSKRKISFATSFGRYLPESEEDKKMFTKLFHRYAAISVREQEGVDLCRDIYGVNATQVLEPVFDITKDKWMEIAEHSKYNEEGPYLLTYILDPTPQKRAAIEYYSRTLGLKAINILDGFTRVYERNKNLLDLPGTLPNIWCADFLKFFSGATCVITDSFHGVCFSTIFNKPFMALGNVGRGMKRFESLLTKTKMLDKFIPDPRVIPENPNFFDNFNFDEANRIIEEERNMSVEWLKKSIMTPAEQLPPIQAKPCTKAISAKLKKDDCIGCSACVSICPTKALELKGDDVGYYRYSIDTSKCVNCGACADVCPSLNVPARTQTDKPDAYEFVYSGLEEVRQSSSGGAFTALAREAFRRNGFVVGAAWRDDYKSVEQIMISDENDLPKLRKSKYLQSYFGNGIFNQIKEQLDNNFFVLVVACPCQIAGLQKFLKKDYDNLITIDLLCGNSPSSMFFRKYVEDEFPNGLNHYAFRHKDEECYWDFSFINAVETNGNSITRHGGSEDNYQRVYHNHTMCAPHCENCKFQAARRYGDLTIGDFWGIGKHDTEIDTRDGVSFVGINNEKGRAFFDSIPEHDIKVKKKAVYDWLGGNGMTRNGHNYASENRDDFYKVIKSMKFSDAVDYALKPNHGIYPNASECKNALLQYNTNQLHFTFDDTVWEEHFVNGATYLYAKMKKTPFGKYATLPLNNHLTKGKTYTVKIKFKVRTDENIFNFHLKDSGSRLFKVIHTAKITPNTIGKWQNVIVSFECNSNLYDEFMIGAGHLSGDDAYIAFEKIVITEDD